MNQLCVLASHGVYLPAKEVVQDADSRASNGANVLNGVEGDRTTLIEFVLSTSEQGLKLVAALLVTRATASNNLAYG